MVFERVGKVLDNVKQIPSKVESKIKSKLKGDIYKIKKKYNKKQEVSEEELRKIANYKVMFKKSISMHIFWYIAIHIMLVPINLIFSPMYLWFILVSIGWIITGTIMHGTAYVLYTRGVTPGEKRGLIYHINSYVSVNIALIIINTFTIPSYLWVFYPIFYWGVGLVFHTAFYFMLFSGKTVVEGKELSRKEAQIERELQKMKIEIKQRT